MPRYSDFQDDCFVRPRHERVIFVLLSFTSLTTTPPSGPRPADCCVPLVMRLNSMRLRNSFLKRLPNDAGLGCILLDIEMPDISGPELQDRLNGRASSLPIIFLTGRADIPTTVQVIKAGAEDLLKKPVPKDSLVEAIERALARARTMREKHEQLEHLRALV